MSSKTPETSYRYRVAAYWWIATEVARRNPGLNLVETYIQDGFYDMLTLHGELDGTQIHIDFNRPGSIHVHPNHVGFRNADDVMGHDNAHAVVKEIESVAGLTPTENAISNGRIITLRLMAQTLNYLVNDISAWDLRMISSAGDGPSLALFDETLTSGPLTPFPELFPTEREFHAFLVFSRLPETFQSGRLWGLQQDGHVVAIFDTKGVVHTREIRSDIKKLYTRSGRNLTQTMTSALGYLLP